MILLIEPVVATYTSNFFWNTPLANFFFVGAGLVLIAGAPLEELRPTRVFQTIRQYTWLPAVRQGLAFALILVSGGPAAAAQSKILHLLEVVPPGEGDYTNSKEVNSIDVASGFAIADYRQANPSCKFLVSKSLSRGTEEDLFIQTQKIARAATNSEVAVGFTRSNFAKVAANAAKGTELKAISVGAATTELSDINKNFYSVAAPWTEQWIAINREMTQAKCKRENTAGLL